jgi:hypothetical protein
LGELTSIFVLPADSCLQTIDRAFRLVLEDPASAYLLMGRLKMFLDNKESVKAIWLTGLPAQHDVKMSLFFGERKHTARIWASEGGKQSVLSQFLSLSAVAQATSADASAGTSAGECPQPKWFTYVFVRCEQTNSVSLNAAAPFASLTTNKADSVTVLMPLTAPNFWVRCDASNKNGTRQGKWTQVTLTLVESETKQDSIVLYSKWMPQQKVQMSKVIQIARFPAVIVDFRPNRLQKLADFTCFDNFTPPAYAIHQVFLDHLASRQGHSLRENALYIRLFQKAEVNVRTWFNLVYCPCLTLTSLLTGCRSSRSLQLYCSPAFSTRIIARPCSFLRTVLLWNAR